MRSTPRHARSIALLALGLLACAPGASVSENVGIARAQRGGGPPSEDPTLVAITSAVENEREDEARPTSAANATPAYDVYDSGRAIEGWKELTREVATLPAVGE